MTEQFRGTQAREIDLFVSFSYCDLSFQRGDDWIIYASPHADGLGLTAGICSRSRRLQHARRDLDYARSAYSRESDRGRVFGRLASVQRSKIVPVAGVLISLTYGDRSLTRASAVTDASGRYEMMAHPGNYVLSARLPRGMTLGYHPIINLPDPRGCVEEELFVDYTGELTGRVVDYSGAPARNLTVELIKLDAFDAAFSRLRVISDNSGYFAATDVAVGRYKAGVVVGSENAGGPRYFLLGRPTNPAHEPQFQIEGGNTRALGTLALPEGIRVTQINGVVVNKEGRPEPGTTVRVKADVDGAEYPWTTISTDKQGRFNFGLVVGIDYRIVVERWDIAGVRRFTIVKIDPPAPSPLRIVLQ